MAWMILKDILYTGAAFATIYILGSVIITLFAKLEEDEEGNLNLDYNSWHFKVAFPVSRHERWFLEQIEDNTLNLSTCSYRRRFSHGFFILWPLILLYAVLGNFFLIPISFLFAHYSVYDSASGNRCPSGV